MTYEPVIGLEVHVQLKTQSKIFCACSTQFGDEPNSNTCPVCLGLPGSLPVLNKKVLELGIMTALALNCQIARRLKFDRKNYFYPDLPKAYQISQFDMPVSYDGHLMIRIDGATKRIGITRAHLEEDAGKLLHEGIPDGSHVDYNRTGTPLLEIVSEPDIRSPEEAYAYLTELKAVLEYLEVSDCNMEEGSLRCDANVSIRPVGQKEFGTKAEIKNLNSFKAVQRALQYEIKRQNDVLNEGSTIVQETRLWNDAKGVTFSMRSKEEAHDYRYFPEPDLVPFTLKETDITSIKDAIVELPREKEARFIKEYGLSDYDAGVLVQDKKQAAFFENCVALGTPAKQTANWITGDVSGYMNANGLSWNTLSLKPEQLAELIQLIEKGTISGKIAKEIVPDMIENDLLPSVIVEKKGLAQVSNTGELEAIAEEVIAKNQQTVDDFRAGRTQAIGRLVGEIMKATKGKANPKLVNEILQNKLS